MKNGHNSCGVGGDNCPIESSKTDFMEDGASCPLKERVPCSADHTVNGFEKSSYQDGEDENLCCELEQPGVSAGEEVWEEHGCVLWDLSASRTHAELMVVELHHVYFLFMFSGFILIFITRQVIMTVCLEH